MIIYKTVNLVNGKIYIGQDSMNNSSYLGSGVLLKKAIEKYGIENFKKETVEVCDSKDELNQRERYWIDHFQSRNPEVGYNLAEGGCGGNTHTEESKKRMSEKLRGRKLSQETIDKIRKTRILNPEKYKHSEETKKLIGSYHKGKAVSEEQRRKTSERMKEFDNYSKEFLDEQKKDKRGKNSPMYGKTASEATKKKMSESHKKNPVRYWKGKKKTRESIDKAVTSRKNKTPEQKLEYYVKWYYSKFNTYPTEEQKQEKYKKYLMDASKC